MMKVVIDTNVFVSSFFGGNPRRIVDLWKSGVVLLCLSKPIIDEYVDVLKRLGLNQDDELAELLSLLASGYNVLFTAKTPKLHVVEDDPDDDKFISCAVALRAEYIISGDKALISIKDYMGIKIMTPTEFLRIIQTSAD
jgi:putative PIN family toxin of toxin-antitoxin system